MPDKIDILQLGKKRSNTTATNAELINKGSRSLSDYDLNSADYNLAQTNYNPKSVLKNQGLEEGEADEILNNANEREKSQSLWNVIKNGLSNYINPKHKEGDSYIQQVLTNSNKMLSQAMGLDAFKNLDILKPEKKSYDELINESSRAYIENKGVSNFLNKQQTVRDFSTGQDFDSKEVSKYLDSENVVQRLFGLGSDALGNKLLTLNNDNFTKLATGDPNAQGLLLEGDTDNSQRKMFFSYKDPEDKTYKLGMVNFKDRKEIERLGGAVISAYGPKPFKENLTSAFKNGLIETLGSTPKMIANFNESTTDLWEALTPLRGKREFLKSKDDGFSDKVSNYFNDIADIYQIQSSNQADANQFGAESLTRGVGSGIGSLAQFIALGTGARIGAEGTGLAGLLESRLGAQAGKKAFNEIVQFGAGAVLNHGEAYDSARKAGLSEEARALFALTVGGINSVVESKFGSNTLFDNLTGGGERTVTRAVLNDLREELGQDLSRVTSRQIIGALDRRAPSYMSKIMGSFDDILEKKLVGPAIEEGTEEFLQTLVSRASENLYDSTLARDRNVGEGRFGTEFFSSDTIKEALQSALIGAIVGGLGDTRRALTSKFSPHAADQGILPHIVDGNAEKIKGVVSKLSDEGFISENIKDAYLDRITKLDELNNNNSSAFSNLDNYKNKSLLKSEALTMINGIFNLKTDINNISKKIAEIKSDTSLSDVEKAARVQKEENKIYDKQTNVEFFDSLLKDYTNDETNPDNKQVRAGEENYKNRDEVIQSRFYDFVINKKLSLVNTEIDNLNNNISNEEAKLEFLSNDEEGTSDTRKQADEVSNNLNVLRNKLSFYENNKRLLNDKLSEIAEHYSTITSKEYQDNITDDIDSEDVDENVLPETVPDTTNTRGQVKDINKPDDVVDRDKNGELSEKDKLEQEVIDIQDQLQNPDLDEDTKKVLTDRMTEINSNIDNLNSSNSDTISDDVSLIAAVDNQLLDIDTNNIIPAADKVSILNKMLNDLSTRVEGNRAKGINDNTHFDGIINSIKKAITTYKKEAQTDAEVANKNKAKEDALKAKEASKVGNDNKNVFEKDNFFTTVYRLPFMEGNAEFWSNEEIQNILLTNSPENLLSNLTISYRPIESLGNYKAGDKSSDTKNPFTKLIYPKLNAVVQFNGRTIGLLPESDKIAIQTSNRGLVPINWNTIHEETFRTYLSSTADFDLTVKNALDLQKLESLAKEGKIFSGRELANLGININITSTGVQVESGERLKIKDLQFAKLPENDNKPLIFDRSRSLIYSEGSLTSLNDLEGLNIVDPTTLNVSDRYLVLTKLSNGSFQWVTSQAALLTSDQKDKVFGHMKSIAEKLKADPSNTQLFIKLKDDLNKLLYITGKPNQDITIEVTAPKGKAPGRVLLSIRSNGERVSYALNKSAKNFDQLFSKIEGINDFSFRQNLSLNPSETELNNKLSVNSTANVVSNLELKINFDTDKLNTTIRNEEVDKAAQQFEVEDNAPNPFADYNAELSAEVLPEVQEEKNEQVDKADKIAQVKAIRNDFDKLPNEAQQEILEGIDNELLDNYINGKALVKARATKKVNDIINSVINNPKYGIKEEGDGLVFSVSESRALEDNLIDIENSKAYLEATLPSGIELRDMNTLLSNIVNKGSTWGAFVDNVIYLSKEAGEGTQYHEAFHAIFRLMLNDTQIGATLNAAKAKFGEPTKEDIENLRNISSVYKFLTEGELRDLYLEEKLANDFKKYKLDKIAGEKNNSVFKRIWDKIVNFFNYVLDGDNYDNLSALYYNIDAGRYKNRSFKTNKFSIRDDIAFEIFQTDDTGEKTTTIKEGKNIVYTLAGLLFKANQISNDLNNEEILNDLIKEKQDFYSLDNPFFDSYFEDNNIEDGTDRFNRTVENINRLNRIYTKPENISKMKKAVLDMYKIFTTEDVNKDDTYENEVNDIGERWDLDPWSLGGMSSLSTAMREYIAFTLYPSKDIFGRNIETAVDPLIVYRGLTRSLAGLAEDQMLTRFKQHVEFNDEAKAFFTKFINDTGLDTETMNLDTAKNVDLLRKFINAFKNENVGWYTVLHDNSTKTAKVIESNRKSAKNLQVDEWSNKFLAIGGDRLSTKDVKDKFINALSAIKSSYNKVGVPIDEETLNGLVNNIVNDFKKLGINISKGYVYFSLLDRQIDINIPLNEKRQEFYNSYSDQKGLFTNNFEDLNEITSQIAQGNNPFVRKVVEENGKKIETGAVSRLERFAEVNALFDESIGESTFQNADGKNVYSILKSSYGLTKLRLLKDKAYRESLKEDKFLYPDGLNLNHLLNNEYSDEIFSAINQSMLDGYRAEDGEGTGVTFGKFSGKDYLQTELALFLNRKTLRANLVNEDGRKVSTKVANLGYFNFNQMEASNTAYLINLPIDTYFSNNKINDKALNILFDYFTQEALRIGDVVRNYGKTSQIFKGYNDKETSRGFKFFEFKNVEGVSAIESHLKDNKLSNKDILKYLESNKETILNNLRNKIIEDINEFTKIAEENSVDLLKGTQEQLGKKVTDKNKNDIVGDYYLNSYINTLGINNLLIGNAAKSLKDTVDWFKRAKGIIGSGNDLGLGTTNVAVFKDPIRYLDKNLNRTEDKDADAVSTSDAQSYITLEHRITEVNKWGRFNSEIRNIYNKIENGKKVSFEEYKKLAENGAALNSVKTVTYDGEHYFKLSELILTPGLVGAKDENGDVIMDTLNGKPFPKTPLKGFEYLYNLYKSMVVHGVDHAMPETASKMATLNSASWNEKGNFDFSNSIMPIDNRFKRLQVETPTGKTKIVDGTQLIQLISSEQDDNLKVDFTYNSEVKNLGDLRTIYRTLLADNRYTSFKDALSYVVDPVSGEANISKLADKFYNTVKDSGSGEVLSNFFKPDANGNRQFNWNLGPIVNKAEQLFLAHFSKGVLSQKVPGLKVSLVSDEGITKPNGEKLQHMVKDADGNYYSECMLPAFAKELVNKNPDDISDVLKMFGIRIPTQDKHSMISLKVVGFLPVEYGSVGVFPYELVHLSGADFDIDSLYIHRPDYYMEKGNPIPYGKYADTDEKKFNEWLQYQLAHNHDFRDILNEYSSSLGHPELREQKAQLLNDINNEDATEYTYQTLQEIKNILKSETQEVLEAALKDSGLPSNLEEFIKLNPTNIGTNNNAMLEAKIKFLTNDFVRNNAAKVPATMDSIKDANKLINSLRNAYNYNTSPNTPYERFKANRNNSEGKLGIGPIALMNNLHAFLSIHDVKLKSESISIDGTEATGFGGNMTLDGEKRKNDEISSLLSAMTDNAKEQLAAKLNLTFAPGQSNNTLPVAGYMLSLGYNMEQTMLFLNQPVVYNLTKGDGKLYSRLLKNLDVRFQKSGAWDKSQGAPDYNKQFNNWLFRQFTGLTSDIMKDSIGSINYNDEVFEENIPNELLISQVIVNSQFKNLIKEARFTSSVSNLLSLNKGLESTFIDNKKFDRAINDTAMGYILAYTNKTEYKDALEDLVKANVIVKSGDRYIKGGNYPELVIDKRPFDPRMAVINDPNTFQNILIQKEVVNKIANKFFLSQTNLFKNLTSSFTNADENSYKYLRGIIMSRSYQKYLQDNRKSKFNDLINSYNNYGGTLKSDPNNIAKQLLDMKANPAFGKNPLVRILSVDDSNPKSKFVNVTFPTRIKTDTDYYVSLVNGFEELFRSPETKSFAVGLFNYVYFKDGLDFKNNSFINTIGSWMFKDVSLGLDNVNEELSEKTSNLETTIKDELSITKDFIKLYSSDINSDEKAIKNLRLADIKSVVNQVIKFKEYEINVLKDSGYNEDIILNQEALNAEMFNPNSKIAKNINLLSAKLGANENDSYTNFNFPVSFVSPSYFSEAGESVKKKAFILSSITKIEDNGIIKEYTQDEVLRNIIDGKVNELSGYKAKYQVVDEIGDKLITSSVFTYDTALELKNNAKVQTKAVVNLDNTEKNGNFAELSNTDSQEAKDETMFNEVKNSPFIFNDFSDESAISNDSINEKLDDLDDDNTPIC